MANNIKLVETKIAKQLSAYSLIHYDLDFAIHAFDMAAQISVDNPNIQASAYIGSRMTAIKTIDPILKSGAAAMLADANRSESKTMKAALFEAAIVSYARCFNAGLRTGLSKKTLSKEPPSSVELHDQIMMARNKHIAHSEMKQERSIIGFRNVEDPSYGARPSTVLSTIVVRRNYPTNGELVKLSNHCRLVDEKIVQPFMLQKAIVLRERLLDISDEEREKMKNFEEVKIDCGPLFS